MVKSMKPGSVIVDMAAEQGGNCELHGARRGRRPPRRHDHRLHGPAEPPREAGVDAVRDEPLPPDGRHAQDQEHRRRCRQRRHGGRGPARHDRHQEGRGHLAAAPAQALGGAAAGGQAAPRRRRRRRPHGHGASSEPMAARSLAMLFGVGALLFLLVGRYAPAVVPRALHRVRARLLRRLHGGLERDARAAHAADERDQRDLAASSPSARWCRSRRRSREPAATGRTPGSWAWPRSASCSRRSTCSAASP